MRRAEALRQIADLHTAWALEHGDDVPYVKADEGPAPSDLSVWQADRSASPEIDDPLNEAIKAILAQIDDDEPATAPTNRAPRGPLNVSAADIDLSKVQRDFERRLGELLSDWESISADQRAQILDQVRAAVTSDDLNALARISVSTTAAELALTEAMTDIALDAAQRVVEEAAEQDVRIDPVASDSAGFAAMAAVVAALLGEGLTNSAGREALRRWSPATTGDEVAGAVREHLESLSTAFVEANLGGALTSAQNTGRLNTMLSAPSAALYASEQMDKNTCGPCRTINGKWLGNSDDPDIAAKVEAVYPNGGYKACLGGVRCRGTIVSVYRPRQVGAVGGGAA